MTQDKIDELKSLAAELVHRERIYKETCRRLNERIDAITASCDHANPDGSTALESGFTHAICRVCGESF